MTEATAGYGTILNWNSQPIAEVTNITGPSLTIDQIDCTHYTSIDQFKEWIAGFGDAGEIGFDCNFIPGDTLGQIAFIDDAYAKTVRDVAITLGDPIIGTWTFDGLVTKLDFTQPMDNKVSFAATIKISGVPMIAVNASLGLTTLTGVEETGTAALDFIPNFANAKYTYGVAVINTASTWVKFTATQLTNPHTIRVRLAGGAWTTLTSGVLSGQLAIGAADTLTQCEIQCWEVGKIRKTYWVNIPRP